MSTTTEEVTTQNATKPTPQTKPEDPPSCPICAEKYTPIVRREVKCQFCNFCACIPCLKKYLLSTTRDPHCMNKDCNLMWNDDFINDTFTVSWRNGEYKAHRSSLLFERERAKLPETMEIVQLMTDAEEYYQKATKPIEDERKKIKENIKQLRDQLRSLEFNYTTVQNQIWPFQFLQNFAISGDVQPQELERIKRIVYQGESINNRVASSASATEVTIERKQFILPCPATDCRGFLSQRYKCGVCNEYTCSECRELKPGGPDDPNHVCKPEVLETVRMLKRDSKPCPTCGCLIHRVSGCPQMWCTQCHVAFDWNTGRVDSGPVHNPEYFMFLQRTGQAGNQRGPIQRHCGQQLDPNFINRRCNNLIDQSSGYSPTDKSKFKTAVTYIVTNFMRDIRHIEFVEIRNLNQAMRRDENEDPFRHMRIRFLRGQVSDHDCKLQLHQYERKRSRLTNKLNILTMLVEASRDILVRFNENISKNDAVAGAITVTYNELVVLCKYFNYQMYRFCKKHSSSKGYFVNKRLHCSERHVQPLNKITSTEDELLE